MAFVFKELTAWLELRGKDEWAKKGVMTQKENLTFCEAQRRWLWTGVCFRKIKVFLSKDTSLCKGMETGESRLIGTAVVPHEYVEDEKTSSKRGSWW